MAPSLSYSSFVGSSKLRREVKQTASREGTHRSAGRFVTVARKYATHLYCDGSCRHSRGVSGIGVVVNYNKSKTIQHASKRLKKGKNRVPAEVDYEAVLYGLRFSQSLAKRNSVLVMSDHQSVINCLNNKTGTSNQRIKVLRQKIQKLAEVFPRVDFKWIERANNQAADTLARNASGDGCVEHNFEQNKAKLVKHEMAKNR